MDIIRLFRNPTKNLCSPSLFYFAVSAIVILSVFIENIGNSSDQLLLVSSSIKTPSKILLLFVHIIGVILWCWILNLMCKANHPEIAWMIVLFPYIIIALCFVIVMLNKV